MYMDLQGKKALVIGTGLSGVGSVQRLHEIGALPVVLEQNDKLSADDVRNKLREEDRAVTEIYLQEVPDHVKDEIAVCVPSPAVPLDTPFMQSLKERDIPVWSEIELAYRYGAGQVIAITGTNGKTTTTTLVHEIMKAHFRDVRLVGNIGYSYAGCAGQMKEESVVVAEVSSFQLEAVQEFHAHVSAILNITPDHLDRHHTMEQYAYFKEQVTNLQTKDDTCVLNYDNTYTREIGQRCVAHVTWFSSTECIEDGIYLDGEHIMMKAGGVPLKIMNMHDMHLVGICNVENVMAAIGIALAMEVPLDTILHVIRHFKAVEHRIEYVATKAGVDYYNDSKATNPDAAIQGIRAMSKPTVLIGGGYDKDADYTDWIMSFDGKVKELILIGATKEKIAACAKENGFDAIRFAESFEEAMQAATESAVSGDAVLLSPACASWGMFTNYEQRGRTFKEYVNRLK